MRNIVSSIFLLIFSVNVIADCAVKLRVYNSPPYYFKNEQGNWSGLAVELSSAIINEAKCTISFVDAPWKRSLYLMKHGQIDMMSGLSKTTERSVYIDFFAKQSDETISIVVPSDSDFVINSLEDLKKLPYRIGMFHGSFHGKELKDKLENDFDFSLKVQKFSSIENIMKSIRHKRLSGFFYNKKDAAKLLEGFKDGQNYKVHPFIVYQDDIFYGLSRKSVGEGLRQRLLEAYLKVQQRDTFDEIYERYK